MAKTTAGRLADVEATLSPTQLVNRWLDEAQLFGSFAAYADSLLEGDPRDFPLDRLLREAMAGVRATVPKGPAQDGALRTALRETAFRFQLVLAINVKAHELVDVELLYNQIVTTQMCLYLAKDAAGAPPTLRPELFAATAQIAEWRFVEIKAFWEARKTLEARYLAAHAAAFPEVAQQFDDRLEEAIQSFGRISRLAELDEIDVPSLRGPESVTTRAEQIVEDLVGPARATALEKLGEPRQSFAIATDWLRRKNRRVEAVAETVPTR